MSSRPSCKRYQEATQPPSLLTTAAAAASWLVYLLRLLQPRKERLAWSAVEVCGALAGLMGTHYHNNWGSQLTQ